jgi:hypothetical protein
MKTDWHFPVSPIASISTMTSTKWVAIGSIPHNIQAASIEYTLQQTGGGLSY